MDCHRRACAVSMRQVDAFPRICSSGPWLTAGMATLLAAIFAAIVLLA